jgi:hypothetical protein
MDTTTKTVAKTNGIENNHDDVEEKRRAPFEMRLELTQRALVPASRAAIDVDITPLNSTGALRLRKDVEARARCLSDNDAPLSDVGSPFTKHDAQQDDAASSQGKASLEDLMSMNSAEMSARNWPSIGDRLMQRTLSSSTGITSADEDRTSTKTIHLSNQTLNESWVRSVWQEERCRGSPAPAPQHEPQRDRSFADLFSQCTFDSYLKQVQAGNSSMDGVDDAARDQAYELALLRAPYLNREKRRNLHIPAPPEFEPPVCG